MSVGNSSLKTIEKLKKYVFFIPSSSENNVFTASTLIDVEKRINRMYEGCKDKNFKLKKVSDGTYTIDAFEVYQISKFPDLEKELLEQKVEIVQ